MHRALQEHLPEGWYAWHSLRVRKGARFEGEGDFVVAVPERGILILEVKGGAIEVRDGQWLQNGRPMRKTPRDQAHGYRGKLKDKLLEAMGVAPHKLPHMAIATAFPDTPFSQGPTEGAVEGAVLGQQDLPYLHEALPALADRVFTGGKTPREGGWITALHNLWCETWTPSLTLGDRTRLRADELVGLDAQQVQLLEGMDQNPRLLVTGGPGTGKTLLARELYQRLTARDHRPLLLCSTLALAAGLKADGLRHAHTVRAFAADLCTVAEVPVQGGVPPSQWSSATWDDIALIAAADALPQLSLPYDALIVDEGQDFSPDDWDFVQHLAGDGHLWVFADAAQGFWRDRGVPEGILPFEYKLVRPYRCPTPLARFADRYRPSSPEPSPHADAPPKPFDELRVVRAPSATSIESKVANEIQRALGEGMAPHDIAVLTLGGQSRTTLGVTERIGPHPVVRADAPDASDHIICDTFLRFKGLERPLVIITELSAAAGHMYDVRMHIALSRATVGCVVVAEGEQLDADPRLAAVG